MERSGKPGGDHPAHAAREWPAVSEALDELTAVRATGALHVDGVAGGSIYLVDGEVYYVHSEAAPGVDCLLQASGTVPVSVFQTAWAAGAAAGQVGEVLIKSGALSRGEAELCTTAAITDGAFAMLTADAGPVRFAPGEGHWWGALRRVGVAALADQVRKRRRLLERTPPTDVDDQPVVATGRLGRHHVVLTDLQWELVVHSDGRRTPRELAKLLGRSTFSAVLETRRLVAAGLVRVAISPGSAPSEPADLPGSGARRTGRRHEPGPRAERTHPVPLPRRQPGAALKGAVRGAGSVPRPTTADVESAVSRVPAVQEPDIALLARVRTALQGLR